MALALGGPAAGDAVQLFTGDCLFPGGVGKTWQDGDFERLLGDVTEPGVRRLPTTRRSSTRATATTPRSAPSGRTSTSGASAGLVTS